MVRSAVIDRDGSVRPEPTMQMPAHRQAAPEVVQGYGPAQTSASDEYIGYLPAPHKPNGPRREPIEKLDAESMWQEYVSKRRPVVIDGLIQDEGFEGARWRDLDYLRSIAGSTNVKIEPVDPVSNQFGTSAQRKVVPLSEFLDVLQDQRQEGKWYMTTQYVDSDDEDSDVESNSVRSSPHTGQSSPSALSSSPPTSTTGSGHEVGVADAFHEELLPKVDLDLELPPPTDAMAHLFPLPTPAIMGGLVLQQCNLWMGNGTSGKSSGLHHDFHDNLYMVLAGRKRFLIWPPVAHPWLEPVGTVFRVHRNGLIEYDLVDEPPLRADGLTPYEAASWLVRARKRAVLDADERAACDAGEAKVKIALRKGKGKQTSEQERAVELLCEAEAHQKILEMASSVDGDDRTHSRSDSVVALKDLLEDEDDDDDEVSESWDGMEEDAQWREDGTRVKRKHSHSHSASEQDKLRGADQQKKPRRERSPSVLRIPSGGLPGGLRGSLNDLDGQYDSSGSEDLDGELTGVVDPLLAALQAQGIFPVEVDDDGVVVPLHVFGEEEDDDDDESDDDEGGEDDDDDDEVNLSAVSFDSSSVETDFGLQSIDNDDDDDDDDDDNDDDDDAESWSAAEDGEALLRQLSKLEEKGKQVAADPASFSRISPQALHWYFNVPDDPSVGPTQADRSPHPPRMSHGPTLLPRQVCPEPMEIHLNPGQMLYLPASWYHEVTSYAEDAEGDSSNVHMALNYWFHPPTAVKPRDTLPRRLFGVRDACEAASAASKARSNFPGAAEPYVDTEIWGEIRGEVRRRVDKIRRKAAATAKKTATTTTTTTTTT